MVPRYDVILCEIIPVEITHAFGAPDVASIEMHPYDVILLESSHLHSPFLPRLIIGPVVVIPLRHLLVTPVPLHPFRPAERPPEKRD
jgi:hypothetical protein